MLTLDIKRKFLNLASALSPENLSCDGELSYSAIVAKKRKLMQEWAELEAQVGRNVNELETWGWVEEIRQADREEREQTMAAQPQHPLLKHSNPGVWSREGENGSSAYYIWNDKLKGPISIAGITLPEGKDEYRLFSEFARQLSKHEEVGTYGSLEKAVEAGEALLQTVTFESFKAANPLYRDENIHRELKRLPSDLRKD